MTIKEQFLKLTEYTIPYGYEHTLLKYLPYGLKQDSFGNYYKLIGESETLFVCHLDTVSDKYVKINHIIDGNIIKTDGKTILGGDNKVGVCILSHMIENNVPGCYYFFLGEEPPHSRLGSRSALKNNMEFFLKFKRVIAFDRKHDCSIITRQNAMNCCSPEFVEELQREYSHFGINLKPDPTGWYTDSATFIKVIPEVTNISSGTWFEHTTKEYVDISFVEKIANASVNIDWEYLPTVRQLPNPRIRKNVKPFDTFNDKTSLETLNKLKRLFNNFMYLCIDCEDFEPGDEITFAHMHEDREFKFVIENGTIYIRKYKIGDIFDLIKYFNLKPKNYVDIDELIDFIYKIINKNYDNKINMNDKIFIKLLSDEFFITLYEFQKLIRNKKIFLENFKINGNFIEFL